MKSILLIDDNQAIVDELRSGLQGHLGARGVEIRTWVPQGVLQAPEEDFNRAMDPRPMLVVTDHDLTGHGSLGLFGSTIVEWCQQLAVPVADYSRGKPGALPKYPDMFELRIPGGASDAAHVAALYSGFDSIASAVASIEDMPNERSPAAILAHVLGRPLIENQLSLYSIRIGQTSGALMSRLFESGHSADLPDLDTKRQLLVYLVGHLLVNSVLRFPGPILSSAAMCGLLATNEASTPEVRALFTDARYNGPFSSLDSYYWLDDVQEILDDLTPGLTALTTGELNRLSLERRLGRRLAQHDCPTRCLGVNGGYYCPFTGRTVCELESCSVASNSWIPQGANLSRIERDFFDEWAPVLGF